MKVFRVNITTKIANYVNTGRKERITDLVITVPVKISIKPMEGGCYQGCRDISRYAIYRDFFFIYRDMRFFIYRISDTVKKLITKMIEMTAFEQQGEPRTSVLLHASSFSSNDKLWDLLPVFVTPRTLFFLPFNAAGKYVDQFDECDRDEYYKRIALIYGSLGKKAKELHGRLTEWN